MKIKKLLFEILCISSIIITSCGQNPNNLETNGKENNTVKNSAKKGEYVVQIPIYPGLCASAMQIAKINGYFDEVGLKYEEVSFSTTSDLDLLATGKADITYDLLPTYVQRIANGLDVKIAGGIHYGCINVVAGNDTGINSVNDLRGKKIAVPSSLGSDPAIMLQRVLKEANIGYTPDNMEVELQVFKDTDLAVALENGSVDAFVSWDPFASMVAKQGKGKLIWEQSKAEYTKDEFCCLAGLRPEFIEEHPEEAKKLMKALKMATDYIVSDTKSAVDKVIEAKYVPDGDRELYVEILRSYNYTVNHEEGIASFARCAEDLNKMGIIKLNQSAEEFAKSVAVDVNDL